jgi:hypothetical protein
MTDPWEDIRKRIDLAETEFERSEILSILADADDLLLVVRALQKAGEERALAGTREVFQMIAALPEHLRGQETLTQEELINDDPHHKEIST